MTPRRNHGGEHRPELILPNRFRIKDRSAAPARLGGGVSGWVGWSLIDRRGREVAGGQSPNMWLDSGLDQIAAENLFLGSTNNTVLGGVSHMAVGTGSTEPAPEQTSLVAELARTSTTFGSASSSRVSDGVYRLTKTWVFDFGEANGNLTEWGVAAGPTGELLTRALFLDEADDPITISKTSDYQLRITYTLEVNLAPVTLQPASLVIDGLGTLNGQFALVAGSGLADLRLFTALAIGSVNNGDGGVTMGLSTLSDWQFNRLTTATGMALGTTVASSYSSGDRQRSVSQAQWGTSATLASVRSIVALSSYPNLNRHVGAQFLIDSGDMFTKDNEHILTLNDILTVTWGRA